MSRLMALLVLTAAVCAGEPEVLRHDLAVALDPGRGTFRSEDKVTVRGPGRIADRDVSVA